MKLTAKQRLLLEWVKGQHGDQKRKYTGEPYWNHVYNVAKIVCGKGYNPLLVEIALCHDLLEDTECDLVGLLNYLVHSGYSNEDGLFIAARVNDLTDVYTKENYPTLNRKARKEKEAKRLHKIHPVSQTVKYADFIDNTISIVEHDKEFAKVYLREKRDILSGMDIGYLGLYYQAKKILSER